MKSVKIEKNQKSRFRDFPTFPLSYFPRVFPPGAPAENLGGGRLIPRIRGEIKGGGGRRDSTTAAGETLARRQERL